MKEMDKDKRIQELEVKVKELENDLFSTREELEHVTSWYMKASRYEPKFNSLEDQVLFDGIIINLPMVTERGVDGYNWKESKKALKYLYEQTRHLFKSKQQTYFETWFYWKDKPVERIDRAHAYEMPYKKYKSDKKRYEKTFKVAEKIIGIIDMVINKATIQSIKHRELNIAASKKGV